MSEIPPPDAAPAAAPAEPADAAPPAEGEPAGDPTPPKKKRGPPKGLRARPRKMAVQFHKAPVRRVLGVDAVKFVEAPAVEAALDYVTQVTAQVALAAQERARAAERRKITVEDMEAAFAQAKLPIVQIDGPSPESEELAIIPASTLNVLVTAEDICLVADRAVEMLRVALWVRLHSVALWAGRVAKHAGRTIMRVADFNLAREILGV